MRTFKAFRQCQSGSIGVLFALAIIPIVAMAGLAIDYARAAAARDSLKTALDAAALSLAHASVNLTQDELQKKAEAAFAGNFHPGDGTTLNEVDVIRGPDFITVSASASIRTAFLNLMLVPAIDVGSESEVMWGTPNDVEVVLALDNTGSMAGEKLAKLKEAANELIDSLKAASSRPGAVKVGLVPFATTVRVNPKDYDEKSEADWIRFDDVQYQSCSGGGGGGGHHGNGHDDDDDDGCRTKTRAFDKSDWEGCIQDRDQSNDVTDIISGKTYGYSKSKSSTLYPALESCPSQENALQTVQKLTTDLAGLKTKINAMKAAGNTNVTIGIAWGLALLSHAAPFEEGVASTDTQTKKYLIVLTDGENTKNRFSTNTNSIDARTKLACKSAREAGTVFAIRVIDGDKSLLENCASKNEDNEPMFFDVKDAGELPMVFRSIGNQIAQLRISK